MATIVVYLSLKMCQPVTTNQRLPFPSIISHKVSYMRVQMSMHRHSPRPLPYAMIFPIYPLIVTLLWCFNTVFIFMISFDIYIYFCWLCNIIYIQTKSYVNAYITLKEMLLISHQILFISVN